MEDTARQINPEAGRTSTDQEITLSELLFVLWRYRYGLIAIVVAAGIVGWSLSWNSTPMFQANSRLLVTPSKIGDQAGLPVVPATYQALISNQAVILEVMKTLGLTEPPHRLSVAEALGRNVSVEPIRDTNILLITTRLADPVLAAAFANRLAERSVKVAQQVAQDDVISVRDTIKVQLDESQRRLEEAERQLVAFRKQAHLEVLAREVDVLVEERAKAMPLLVAIEAERARVRQTIDELAVQEPVRTARRAMTPSMTVSGAPGVTADSKANARESRDAERRVGATPRDPQEVTLRPPAGSTRAPRVAEDELTGERDGPQLTMSHESLDPFVNPVYEILNHQLAASRTKLSELESRRTEILRATDLSKTTTKLNNLYTTEAELERLNREADLARRAYLDASTRYEQARLQVAARTPHIQIIDAAVPSQQPVAPRTFRNTILAVLAALVLSSAAALVYAAARKTIAPVGGRRLEI
jgi:uncharacterized protein involved in exopolysaccharide biosynthesis